MLGDGFKLMVLGMGSVFVFLVLMVYCMNIMSKLLAPFAGMFEKAAPKAAPKPAASSDENAIAAAAVAVVEAFRSK